MFEKVTYKKAESELGILLNHVKMTNLYGEEYYPPLTIETLIRSLEQNNMIGEFCLIIYKLQKTSNYCLDRLRFYLEYKKDFQPKINVTDFSNADALRMIEMCLVFKQRTFYMIGYLLHKGYEPNSVYEFFTEYHISDNRLEAIAALKQVEDFKDHEEILLQCEEEIVSRKRLLRSREEDRKNNPPLKGTTVRDRIMYSPYSEWGLEFAVKTLQRKNAGNISLSRQSFFQVLYTLQYRKRELNIFDKDKFNKFIRNYPLKFAATRNPIWGLDILFYNDDYFLPKYGDEWYKSQFERYISDLEYLEQQQYDYEEFAEILPDESDCDALWNAYTFGENELVFSIAILIHEKAIEWKRVLNYYLTSGEYYMIAKYPKRGWTDPNPYVIHPHLKSLSKTVIKKVIGRNKYRNKSVNDIISKWPKKHEEANRYCFLLIVFCMQMESIEIINNDIFNKIFKKQIENYKIDKNYKALSFALNKDLDSVIHNYIEDKEKRLPELAALIDVGYQFEDLHKYYVVSSDEKD